MIPLLNSYWGFIPDVRERTTLGRRFYLDSKTRRGNQTASVSWNHSFISEETAPSVRFLLTIAQDLRINSANEGSALFADSK